MAPQVCFAGRADKAIEKSITAFYRVGNQHKAGNVARIHKAGTLGAPIWILFEPKQVAGAKNRFHLTTFCKAGIGWQKHITYSWGTERPEVARRWQQSRNLSLRQMTPGLVRPHVRQ